MMKASRSRIEIVVAPLLCYGIKSIADLFMYAIDHK